MRNTEAFFIARNYFGGQRYLFSGHQFYFSGAQVSGSDFRSLGIQHNRHRNPQFFTYFFDPLNPGGMFFMTAVRKIQPCHIHPIENKFS